METNTKGRIIAVSILPFMTSKHTVMKAKISYSVPGKIQVITSGKLSGRGCKFVQITQKGENRYLLTQKAYDKIQHLCEWEN